MNFIPHRVKVHYKALTAMNFIPHCMKVINKSPANVNLIPHRVKTVYKALGSEEVPRAISPTEVPKQGPRK